MPKLYPPTPATFLVQGQSGSQQFHLTIFLDKFLSCCVFPLVCLPERYLQLKKKKKWNSLGPEWNSLGPELASWKHMTMYTQAGVYWVSQYTQRVYTLYTELPSKVSPHSSLLRTRNYTLAFSVCLLSDNIVQFCIIK